MSQWKDTTNVWLFLFLGFMFILVSGLSVKGLQKTRWTENTDANVYITLAIVFGLMLILGAAYFVKVKVKEKIKDKAAARL